MRKIDRDFFVKAGRRGAKLRAKKFGKNRISEIAKRGAKARWDKYREKMNGKKKKNEAKG